MNEGIEVLSILLMLAIVTFSPYIIERCMQTTVPFKAKNAYNIKYEKNYLTFKTRDRKGIHSWAFRGSCTNWTWACPPFSGRCEPSVETVLYDIWIKTQAS